MPRPPYGCSAGTWPTAGRGHKLVAGVGYALSAVCKPVLLAVGASMPAIAAVLAVDRTGKGLRTAPRDALISLSSPPGAQGRAFGVHRALDTTGALLGPLVAFGVLSVAREGPRGGYDAVFVVSTCVAVFGVVILALFVRDRAAESARRPTVRATLAVLRLPGFARICACAMLLGVATISDAFVYLVLQQRTGLPAQYFPLLPVGTAAAFLALAVPLGLVADRLGRWPVFIAGHVVLLLAYGALLSPAGGSTLIVSTLALLGVFYAATDGVLMALAGPLLPEPVRAGGLAILQIGQEVTLSAPGRIVFRDTRMGPAKDHLASVAAADPSGPRVTSGVGCLRFSAAAGTGVCLRDRGRAVPSYGAVILDDRLREGRRIALGGIPTRARVSPSGRTAAWTVFVSGDSYAGTNFSTRTSILDTRTGAYIPSLDLRTMHETPLAEQRSVDDQAVWVDSGTVMYALAGDFGADLWTIPADGTGTPAKRIGAGLAPALGG